MIRKRVIAVLTINNGVLFRTRNFQPDYRYTFNFVDSWSIDEIVLLDVTRPGQGKRENFYCSVQSFAKECFVPLTVGGGVKSSEEFKFFLKIGADKVAVNTHAIDHPDFITKQAKIFGSQCVVISIDAKLHKDGKYRVYYSQGTKYTKIEPHDWAKKVQDLGAGEILIQSIDKDGTLEGYDNNLCKSITSVVQIPVLICSGAGNWSHFAEGFSTGKASGVCTNNIFHFTEASIKSAKKFLDNSGFNVRI